MAEQVVLLPGRTLDHVVLPREVVVLPGKLNEYLDQSGGYLSVVICVAFRFRSIFSDVVEHL